MTYEDDEPYVRLGILFDEEDSLKLMALCQNNKMNHYDFLRDMVRTLYKHSVSGAVL